MVKTRNKFLAMLLAIAMVVTLLPAVVFASAEDIDATESSVQRTSAATVNPGTDNVELELTLLQEDGETAVSGDFGVKVKDGDWFDEEDVTFDANGVATITFSVNTVGSYQDIEVDVEGVVIGTFSVTVEPAGVEDYSSAASRITNIDEDNPDAGEESEITIRFRKADGTAINQQFVTFFVESSRDAETVSVVGEGIVDVNAAGDVHEVNAKTSATGHVKIAVESSVAGEAVLDFFRLYDSSDGGSGKIDSTTITWGGADAGEVVLVSDKDDPDAGQQFTLTATVYDDSGWEIEGETVEFFERYEGRRWTKIASKDTDANGEVELKLRREKAGKYEFEARVSGADDGEYEVNVRAAAASTIVAAKASDYLEEGKLAKVKFTLKDRYGNELDAEWLLDELGADYDEFIEVDITDPDDDDYDYDAVTTDDEKFVVEFTPDDEGLYVVEVFIVGTSISAVTEVNVGEFGDVVDLELDADEFAIRSRDDDVPADIAGDDDYAAYFTKLKVNEYDEAGIKKSADLDDVAFSLSDRSLARLVEDSGDMYLVAGKDVSGVVTVTVVHLDEDLEDSIEISIAGDPVDLDIEVDVNDLEAEVTLTYLDVNGNKSALTADEEDDADYRIILPSGLDYFDKEEFEEGEATASFMLEADEYGSYTVRVITDLGISKTFTVDFVEEEEDAPVARVDFFIGQTIFVVDGEVKTMDVAPFVEDGRTFIPVRFIAEALGAEADWESDEDGYTTVVTLDREDLLVTINIGEDVIQVLDKEDDTVELIEMDVEAFVRDARTWLPFRFVAEAFGAEVDWEAGPQGTERVWFTQ